MKTYITPTIAVSENNIDGSFCWQKQYHVYSLGVPVCNVSLHKLGKVIIHEVNNVDMTHMERQHITKLVSEYMGV